MFENEARTQIVDDNSIRPDATTQDNQILSNRLKGQNRTIILFSIIYFFYGTYLSMGNFLYLKLIKENGLPLWVYGSVLASSHFMCVIFYPLSCRIASEISIRSYLSVSVFMIGSCHILLGSTYLILKQQSFIILSYIIQLVEGIGLSIFYVATAVTVGALPTDQTWKFFLATQISLCLGLILGPPSGQFLLAVLRFDIVFYVVGALTALCAIFTATILKELEQRTIYRDVSIVFQKLDKKMLVYFFLILETFIYVGFLSATLNIILNKLNLNKLYFFMLFSLIPFVYGLSIAGWKWIIKKGLNNVMMIFIGSVATVASLILLGPAPFISLKMSLIYTCLALVSEGLGLACKCTCILDASEKDLRYQKKHTEFQQKLIYSTIIIFGASFGYFFGLVTAGIMITYLEYKKATLLYIALEIVTAIGVVIFALNRNYVSKRRREAVEESQPILQS